MVAAVIEGYHKYGGWANVGLQFMLMSLLSISYCIVTCSSVFFLLDNCKPTLPSLYYADLSSWQAPSSTRGNQVCLSNLHSNIRNNHFFIAVLI